MRKPSLHTARPHEANTADLGPHRDDALQSSPRPGAGALWAHFTGGQTGPPVRPMAARPSPRLPAPSTPALHSQARAQLASPALSPEQGPRLHPTPSRDPPAVPGWASRPRWQLLGLPQPWPVCLWRRPVPSQLDVPTGSLVEFTTRRNEEKAQFVSTWSI